MERRQYKRYHWVRDKDRHWKTESWSVDSEMTVIKVAILIDAILDAWTNCLKPPYGTGLFSPEDGQTDCNRFVNMVAKKMGYDGFQPKGRKYPMLANEMVGFMESERCWKTSSGQSAQYYANQGYFVIAGWINPDSTKSGHVAVVRPGMLGTSFKWGFRIPGVPKVANVAQSRFCRLDLGANWAFRKMPKYYLLLNSSEKKNVG